jgi:hypothetical protein
MTFTAKTDMTYRASCLIGITAVTSYRLDGVTLVCEMRKSFDVLAEGLLSENSRDNRTAIELFIVGIRGWEAGLRASIVELPNGTRP